MEFTKFVRKPFIVEAVKITEENIAEVAPYIGALASEDDGTPYISVTDRKKFPNIYEKIYLGFWLTKMDSNLRCYSDNVFKKQFVSISSGFLILSEVNDLIESKR
jgi:hypothetical protein